MTDLPAADMPTPRPARPAGSALATLESAARRELAQLAAALPPAVPADPLLAHLAWDMGLTGDEVMGPASAATAI